MEGNEGQFRREWPAAWGKCFICGCNVSNLDRRRTCRTPEVKCGTGRRRGSVSFMRLAEQFKLPMHRPSWNRCDAIRHYIRDMTLLPRAVRRRHVRVPPKLTNTVFKDLLTPDPQRNCTVSVWQRPGPIWRARSSRACSRSRTTTGNSRCRVRSAVPRTSRIRNKWE